MASLIRSHRQLEVYKLAMSLADQIFHESRTFPHEERYSMTDQVRRSSRSVTTNLAEAWRKRRYEAAFISKRSDAEAEAAETQTWLEHAVRCGYLAPERARTLFTDYERIIAILVTMQRQSKDWVIQ